MAERIEADQLVTGQIVMVTNTTTASQGFVGKLFKVLAVDWPHGVLLWLESTVFQSRHTVDLRQFEFAIPTKDYVDAVLPEDAWPDVIIEETK